MIGATAAYLYLPQLYGRAVDQIARLYEFNCTQCDAVGAKLKQLEDNADRNARMLTRTDAC